MEVDTRAIRARSSCQLLSLPVLCNKIEICKLWDWVPARSEFLFWASELGTQNLGWMCCADCHILATPVLSVPAWLLAENIFFPLNFQLSFKKKSLRDSSWRLLLVFLNWLMMCPSSASAAQWHPWCVASTGCGCCTHRSALASVWHRLLLLTFPLWCLWRGACSPNRNVEANVEGAEIMKKWMWAKPPGSEFERSSKRLLRQRVCDVSTVCSTLHLKAQVSGIRLFRDSHWWWQQWSWQASAVCQTLCRNKGEHSAVQAAFVFCFQVAVCRSLALLP